MKTTLSFIILLMVATTTLSAQELPKPFTETYGGRIEATQVLSGSDKSDNYNKALKWATQNYSTHRMINGSELIVIQTSTELDESPRPWVGDDDNSLHYNIELWFEGSEVRVVISNIKNFAFAGGAKPLRPIEEWYKVRNNGQFPQRFTNTLENVQNVLDAISEDLKAYLK